jgi:hypothetical protein
MIVFANAAGGRDDDFNRWYDEVHLPDVLGVPGFVSAQRFELTGPQMFPKQRHRYVMLYEIEGDVGAALEALRKASPAFERTDAMVQDAHVVVVEPIGPRRTAG